MNDEPIAPRPPFDPHPTPLKDAIDKLGSSGEGFDLNAGRDTSGHAGVMVGGTKVFGKEKEWSASAAVAWAKTVGYAVMGKLKWTPK